MKRYLIVLVPLLLFFASTTFADDLEVAKVYRDYPGYLAPPVCDNPQLSGSKSTPPPKNDSVQKPQHSGHHYLGIWGGANYNNSNDLEFEIFDLDTEYRIGYVAGVQFGYDFGALRLELEGSYRENSLDKFKIAGFEINDEGDVSIEALFANLYYDIDTGGYSTPYIGVGVGWAEVSLNDIEIGGIDVLDDHDQVLAGQAIIGIEFPVTTLLSFDVGYRFMMMDSPQFKDDFGFDVDTDIYSHAGFVGLKFRF